MGVPKARHLVKGSELRNACYIECMKWLIVSALFFPLCAAAQETQSPAPKTLAELYPPLPGVEYYCTNSYGDRVEIGGVICITASCNVWMARCEMTSTNRMAIWRKTQDGCLGASVTDRLQALQPAA